MGFLQANKAATIGFIVAALLFVVVAGAVILAITLSDKIPPYVSNVGYYSNAAVATDYIKCSELGRDILKKGGTAVDAAIASMYCSCTFNMQSCGIGGGFFMMVYQKPNSGSAMVMEEINARETAPAKSTPDMYQNVSSTLGGLAIGVPGQVMGSYVAWKKYGKLPWKDLLSPTLAWLKDGFKIPYKLGHSIERSKENIKKDPEFSKYFLKADGSLLKEGDILKLPKLAATMEKIIEDPDSFYKGDLASDIVKDIQDAKGIVILDDLKNYQANSKAPYSATIPGIGLTLNSISPPGSGPVLALMLKIIDAMNVTAEDLKDIKGQGNTYQRIVEAMKFAFATKTYLGDDRYIDVSQVLSNISSKEFIDQIVSRITLNSTHPIEYYNPSAMSSMEDKGTSHLSVLASDGSAAAITTTINLGFGSGVMGSRTGIIFNNEMDDFTLPNIRTSYGTTNLIQAGKRPQSSMIPSIYTDKEGKVRFVMGAAGGPFITSSNFYVMTHRLWLNYTLEDAMNITRFHHQLIPNHIVYEPGFNQAIVNELKLKGHKETYLTISVMQGIENRCKSGVAAQEGACITAVSDFRGGGTPAGI